MTSGMECGDWATWCFCARSSVRLDQWMPVSYHRDDIRMQMSASHNRCSFALLPLAIAAVPKLLGFEFALRARQAGARLQDLAIKKRLEETNAYRSSSAGFAGAWH